MVECIGYGAVRFNSILAGPEGLGACNAGNNQFGSDWEDTHACRVAELDQRALSLAELDAFIRCKLDGGELGKDSWLGPVAVRVHSTCLDWLNGLSDFEAGCSR